MKNKVINANGNSIKNQIYVCWFASLINGSTALPETSAIPAKIAITVSGFLIVDICFGTMPPLLPNARHSGRFLTRSGGKTFRLLPLVRAISSDLEEWEYLRC